MAEANVGWGAPRIHGELLKLGIDIGERSVSRFMPPRPRKPLGFRVFGCRRRKFCYRTLKNGA